MYFTEGRLHAYERMMQEKPGHEREPAKAVKDRDYKNCLHSGNHGEKSCKNCYSSFCFQKLKFENSH